ncbi:MAG: type III-A CRISPR-associated protein Csm2 [Paludibacteraceae bacterium]|nr:type III-A CRISPR-associated protein Csm2 [Paludibacteraceae bacterium]
MGKYPSQKMEKSWVWNGITPDIVEWTKSFGEYLCKKNERNPLTTGQLRKFFGEVKRIEADAVKHKAEIPMLKPLLAYAVGRDKKKAGRDIVNKTKIQELEEEISKAVDAIRFDNDDVLKSDYKNFVQIFESIVAYHKYFGGQENNN